MKKYLTLLVLAGSLTSLSAWSAESLSRNDTGQLRPAGTVSVTGAANLDDLQAKLAEKAKDEGASGFVVNSARGENRMP